MKDITTTFGAIYNPVKALIIYEKKGSDKAIYVESYDMDENGCPINAHPLSMRESSKLASALDTSDELRRSFLKPSGLLPKNVLYINPDNSGFAVWTTEAKKVDLFFIDTLGIPNGKASIPPLLWKASKDDLYIYALDANQKISEKTLLYEAPFFNLYQNGRVCMGTVAVNIKSDCMLEEFMTEWEKYFFNSYFSHLIKNQSPVKGNIVQLWQSLVGTGKKFPTKSLIKNGMDIKKILS